MLSPLLYQLLAMEDADLMEPGTFPYLKLWAYQTAQAAAHLLMVYFEPNPMISTGYFYGFGKLVARSKGKLKDD